MRESRWRKVCALLFWFSLSTLFAAEDGSSVIVIYNGRAPESRPVADYYAKRRGVPKAQVFGFDLPLSESMRRDQFINDLQNPLLGKLEKGNLFTFGPDPKLTNGAPSDSRVVVGAKIRYAVLCYGVPTKITRDTALIEPDAAKLRPELQRNEASVDSQLACLPLAGQKLLWAGPLLNRLFGVTNSALLSPANGILLVTRLDGPTADIARALVDKAIDAETNGLWGRTYFDAGYSVNNSNYALGDEWIRGAARTAMMMGYETELDEKPGTFPASFPMSHIAFYAGWYDGHVSGPFTRSEVEFMPGAFAYHLHSFSAATLRSKTENWVGPLLTKGATVTMGSVDEPYLGGTPDIARFMALFTYFGFSFGEAAWACQSSVSWQNIAVGDPLYRPFGRSMAEMHSDLATRGDPRIEWSHLRLVNLNQLRGTPANDLIKYLEQLPVTALSAVLKEKLADFYWAERRIADALATDEAALRLNPSPRQKMRIMLRLAERRAAAGQQQAEFEVYQKFVKEFPDYSDLLAIYHKLLPLAKRLEKKNEIEKCEQEIKRLTEPAAGKL